ncbi:lipid A biosynthesis (KDO) 2-(lauroyl)-lipid IVA acyltransferase [Klebsiella quasipneumoniae]|nr:lipid A biosynthesis (KDO) 2-(lauroyl)-lipid IVA acyltransferase [Klebsiella quasipneumoniae]
MSVTEREALLVKNFESLGMGLMETGMAWFWPTHRVARWTETSGVNEVVELLEQKQGILLIGIHFLTLEMGARMYGMFTPGIGVYRPNDNPLIDWLQTWGRLRSNKTMLDRKNLKGMVRALKEGEILWYAPDHDYGPASSVFCAAVCCRAGGDHHRHLDAGEDVRGDDCTVCSATQTQRYGI